jgi:hypothetical protein
MLSWLARRLVDYNMGRLRAGEYRLALRLDAKDVRFRFPGDSSWAVELEGKTSSNAGCRGSSRSASRPMSTSLWSRAHSSWESGKFLGVPYDWRRPTKPRCSDGMPVSAAARSAA